jgi:hypothetical protein
MFAKIPDDAKFGQGPVVSRASGDHGGIFNDG